MIPKVLTTEPEFRQGALSVNVIDNNVVVTLMFDNEEDAVTTAKQIEIQLRAERRIVINVNGGEILRGNN